MTSQKTRPYRVNFMNNHPLTGDILMSGDVVHLPEFAIQRQIADGVYTLLPEGTEEMTVNRGEKSRILGYNTDPTQYEAEVALAALGDKLPPALLAQARDSVLAGN